MNKKRKRAELVLQRKFYRKLAVHKSINAKIPKAHYIGGGLAKIERLNTEPYRKANGRMLHREFFVVKGTWAQDRMFCYCSSVLIDQIWNNATGKPKKEHLCF